MNLALIQDRLGAWVTAATAEPFGASGGLPVYWRGRAAGYRKSHALLFVSGLRTVGQDCLLFDEVTAVDEITGETVVVDVAPVQQGQRELTLEVQVRCYRTTEAVSSRHFTAMIRDCLRLPDSQAFFDACGVAFQRVAADLDLTEISDEREMTIAQLDIVFNASASRRGAGIGFVERFETEFST